MRGRAGGAAHRLCIFHSHVHTRVHRVRMRPPAHLQKPMLTCACTQGPQAGLCPARPTRPSRRCPVARQARTPRGPYAPCHAVLPAGHCTYSPYAPYAPCRAPGWPLHMHACARAPCRAPTCCLLPAPRAGASIHELQAVQEHLGAELPWEVGGRACVCACVRVCARVHVCARVRMRAGVRVSVRTYCGSCGPLLVCSRRVGQWLCEYSTVQYSRVQYSTVQYSTVQYSRAVAV